MIKSWYLYKLKYYVDSSLGYYIALSTFCLNVHITLLKCVACRGPRNQTKWRTLNKAEPSNKVEMVLKDIKAFKASVINISISLNIHPIRPKKLFILFQAHWRSYRLAWSRQRSVIVRDALSRFSSCSKTYRQFNHITPVQNGIKCL